MSQHDDASISAESGHPPPALREAHAHLFMHGRSLETPRFDHCRNHEEFLSGVHEACDHLRAAGQASEWLVGAGLRVESWDEPRWPTAGELDRVTGSRPACIWSFDRHALVMNSAGLRAAGIETTTPDPPHGRIVRDRQGQATGLLLESAARQAWEHVPQPPVQRRSQIVLAAVRDLSRLGFVEVHDLLSEPWLGPLLAALDRAGQLPMRVVLHPRLEDLHAVLHQREAWESERVYLGGAKVFADGTVNSRTAWLLEPYANPLPGLDRGEAIMGEQALVEAMRRAWAAGVSLAVHAIGDAAVRAALDAFEQAVRTARVARPDRAGPTVLAPAAACRLPRTRRVPALRIEHAELIHPADVPRVARLGVVCSVQPAHLLTDVEALRRGVPDRLTRVLPLRDLIAAGCTPGRLLWFGSDAPIVPPDPMAGVQAAVWRRRPGEGSDATIAPRQAIRESEAWAAYAATPLSAGP